MSDDLVAFLRARLDEDARTAQAAEQDEGEASWTDGGKYGEKVHTSEYGSPVAVGPWTGLMGDGTRGHIARHDPTRVLREVEAKRQLVREFVEVGSVPDTLENRASRHWEGDFGYLQGLARAVELLAAVYADHPDYRSEWRPGGTIKERFPRCGPANPAGPQPCSGPREPPRLPLADAGRAPIRSRTRGDPRAV